MPDIAQKDTLPDVTLATDSELQVWRTGVLNVLLTVVSVAAVPPIALVVSNAIRHPEQWPAALVFLAIYLFVVVLAVFRRFDPRLRAWGLLIVGYAAGSLAFARGGLVGDGPMYFLALPMLAMILVGVRSGLIMTGISVFTFAAFAFTAQIGWLERWLIRLDNSLALTDWASKGTTFAMLLISQVVLQWFFSRFQTRTLQASRERATELSQTQSLLQDRVQELNRRAQRFEAIARISRDTMALLEPEEMLQRTAESIKEQFGFEAVAVYLAGESDGEIGLRAIAGATLPVLSTSTALSVNSAEGAAGASLEQLEAVTQTILSGILRVTQPSAEEAEGGLGRLVLPLRIRDQTIGALAVQTRAAFSAEDTAALQMLADQIATAIENTRLFSESQASLRELNALYRQYTAGAWEEYVQSQPGAMRYSQGSLTCSAATWRVACEQARASSKAVAFTGDADAGGATRSLAVPVILRGLSLGVLGFHRPAGASVWQLEEIAMVRMIADRLALAVENIRLLENTQRRARQEQLVGEVTTRIRAPMDMDTILQTAVQELGQALEAGRVSFYLAPEEEMI
ncbi:MAG: GAF domain-containing protein [Chloroflexota bacterium]|nr:GAF domain-containing protein [Chloroflexota bacterium]